MDSLLSDFIPKNYVIKILVMFVWRTKLCGFPFSTGWSCWQHVNIDTIHLTFYTFFLSLHSYINFTYIKKNISTIYRISHKIKQKMQRWTKFESSILHIINFIGQSTNFLIISRLYQKVMFTSYILNELTFCMKCKSELSEPY